MKKNIAKLCILLMMFSIIAPAAPVIAAAASKINTGRLAGENRYLTATKVSQTGWKDSPTAIIASSANANLVDALTVAPLARLLGAPILLTEGNSLNTNTRDELDRLLVETVYVASGSAVISPTVLRQIEGMGIDVIPLGGRDRFETSLNVAREMDKYRFIQTAVVTTAFSNADALSVAPIAASQGWPILLSNKDVLPEQTQMFIDSIGIEKGYVVGGEGVISDDIVNSLPEGERIGGDDRYATNLLILQRFASLLDSTDFYVANGTNGHLVDSLVASSFIAGHPLLLVNNVRIDRATREFLAGQVIANAVALGGEATVSNDMLKIIQETAIPDETAETTTKKNSKVTSVKDPFTLTENPDNLTIFQSGSYTPSKVGAFASMVDDVTIDAAVGSGIVTLRDLNIEGNVLIQSGTVRFENCNIAGTLTVTKKGKGDSNEVQVYFGKDTLAPKQIYLNNGTVISGYADLEQLEDIRISTTERVTIKTPVKQIVYEGVTNGNIVIQETQVGLLMVTDKTALQMTGAKNPYKNNGDEDPKHVVIDSLVLDGTRLILKGRGTIKNFLTTADPADVIVDDSKATGILDGGGNDYEGNYPFEHAYKVSVNATNLFYDAPAAVAAGNDLDVVFEPYKHYVMPGSVKVKEGSNTLSPDQYEYNIVDKFVFVDAINNTILVTASAKKMETYKVSVKATGLSFRTTDTEVDYGDSLTVIFRPQTGYLLPAQDKITVTVDGAEMAADATSGYVYTVEGEESAAVATLSIAKVTGKISITVPGQKIPSFKLSVKTNGLNYEAYPSKPLENQLLEVYFTPKADYFLPSFDEITVNMGDRRLEANLYDLYMVKDDTLRLQIPKVTGNVAITALGRQLPTYSVKLNGITYEGFPEKQMDYLGQNLIVTLYPMDGFDLPLGENINVIMGKEALELTEDFNAKKGFTYEVFGYDYAVITIFNVTENVVIQGTGIKMPTHRLTVSATGLNFKATPGTPIDDRPLHITFTPKDGYVLPATDTLRVRVGSKYLDSGSDPTPAQYSYLIDYDTEILTMSLYNVTDDVTIVAPGRKVPLLKVSATGLEYEIAPERFTDIGQPLNIRFTALDGYLLPDKSDILISIKGQPNLTSSDYSYEATGAFAILNIPAGVITSDITISIPAKKQPTFKLNVTAPGLVYEVTPKIPLEGEPFTITFTAKEGYFLPITNDMITILMGKNKQTAQKLEFGKEYECTWPDSANNNVLIITIWEVSGNLFIIAPGQKVPKVTVKSGGLTAYPDEVVALGQDLNVYFEPKDGYESPDRSSITVGMGKEVVPQNGFDYVMDPPNSPKGSSRITVYNVTQDVSISVPGKKLPTYKVTINGDGLTGKADPKSVIRDKDVTIELTAKKGYGLPLDYSKIQVQMGNAMLKSSDFSIAKDSSSNILTLYIPLVTDNVTVYASGDKLPTYSIQASNLSYTATPKTPDTANYDLEVVFTAKSGYYLPKAGQLIMVMGGKPISKGDQDGQYTYPSDDEVETASTAKLTIRGVTADVSIIADAEKIPVYKVSVSASGLTAKTTDTKPMKGKSTTITLTPKSGYVLPPNANNGGITVQMGSTYLTPIENGEPDPEKNQYKLISSPPYSYTITILDIQSDITITAPGIKIPTYKVTNTNLTCSAVVSGGTSSTNFTDIGQNISFTFRPKTDYLLPDVDSISVKMGNRELAPGDDYKVEPNPLNGEYLKITVENVTENLTVKAVGVKKPTYKVSVNPNGLKYKAVTQVKYGESLTVTFLPGQNTLLPLLNDPSADILFLMAFNDFLKCQIGGEDYYFDDHEVIEIPKSSTNVVESIEVTFPKEKISGNITLTANGEKIPTVKIVTTNLTCDPSAPVLTGLKQPLTITLTPKNGYYLPAKEDVIVQIGGIDAHNDADFQVDLANQRMTVTISEVTNDVYIKADGSTPEIFEIDYKGLVGLTGKSTPTQPIQGQPLTIVLNALSGYGLPLDSDDVIVKVDSLSVSFVFSKKISVDNKFYIQLDIPTPITGNVEVIAVAEELPTCKIEPGVGISSATYTMNDRRLTLHITTDQDVKDISIDYNINPGPAYVISKKDSSTWEVVIDNVTDDLLIKVSGKK